MLSSLQGEQYNHIESVPNNSIVDKGKAVLRWLRDECDHILRQSGWQLPRDELAMALRQVLDSDREVDESYLGSIFVRWLNLFLPLNHLFSRGPRGFLMPTQRAICRGNPPWTHGIVVLNQRKPQLANRECLVMAHRFVCAPTGAVAMIAVLHEVKQHYRDGIFHKNDCLCCSYEGFSCRGHSNLQPSVGSIKSEREGLLGTRNCQGVSLQETQVGLISHGCA
ncbi:hypothetical protein C5167_023738 [Papaver somniferum]|uniref:Uncharacterized protein n=1 Tax=Papaver somniferum TaxID=3469 RepID=A0A4Y7JMM6_PAPSO|nr:hypothetical protein C5167_023738 [Papaver somniferum]